MKLNGNFVCPSCGKGIQVEAKYDSGKPTLIIDIKAVGSEESNKLELEEMEESITKETEPDISDEEQLEEDDEENEEAEEGEPEEDVHY